jgi:hypothetical protein
LWLLIAHAHPQPRALRGDREVLVTQPSHQIEGLLRGLLLRSPERVGFDVLLHRRPYLWRRAEVAVRGDQPVQGLVRSLEVVSLDEEPQPPLAVGEVCEDRAAQKLVPQRLPEALDLAERLRMLRPALDVPDPILAQPLLEERLAAPGCVLPPLVGQDLHRRPVRGDSTLQRFQYQRALLVVRQHEAHHEARVVIHEGCQVEPLVPSQEEGEDVGLPELVRCCPLEAPWWPLASVDWSRHRRGHHPRVRQHALHGAR